MVIHPSALLAVVDPSDFAGDAIEEGIVQADFVADLEDRHLPHGAVLAQQMLGKVQIPVGKHPSFFRIADAAKDADDPIEGREILQRRFAEQEHIPGQQVVGLVDVFAPHPGALDDLGRERAVRDAVALQQKRDGLAPLCFAKQTIGVHPVIPLCKNGKAPPGEGRERACAGTAGLLFGCLRFRHATANRRFACLWAPPKGGAPGDETRRTSPLRSNLRRNALSYTPLQFKTIPYFSIYFNSNSA